jgi:hypothetical protein
MPITDAEILALKPKNRPYRISTGERAYLLVTPNGQKYWRLKYRFDGKDSSFSLGVFPRVSVDAARAAKEAATTLIRLGINPSVARREARADSTPPQPLFCLGLSLDGALTIETDTSAITLTLPQTQALAAFLAATNEKDRDSRL